MALETATVYLHGSKESMHDTGVKLGLKGAALDMFRYACVEVELQLSVDTDTGEASIIRVDGRAVLLP